MDEREREGMRGGGVTGRDGTGRDGTGEGEGDGGESVKKAKIQRMLRAAFFHPPSTYVTFPATVVADVAMVVRSGSAIRVASRWRAVG
jgi:hypothetical protein